MPSSRRKVKKALTSIEKFTFEHICTTLSHTIATPFLKLKCIMQSRNTIIEYNLCTSLSPKCIQNPSLFTLFDAYNICYLFSGNLSSIFRVVVQTASNLAIKEPIKKRIIGHHKRRWQQNVSYSKLMSKKFIAGYIGNVIAINFTLYLTSIVIHKRLCISNKECNALKPYRFGLLQPGFFTTVCKSLVFRSMWFVSCYLVEPYVEARWFKKSIRKILTYTVQYPIDTVRSRQLLTGENGIVAIKNIAQYGCMSFFDGFAAKMGQEFIFLGIQLMMENVKYEYAEWRYDMSGIQKRRKGVMNLRDLCQYRDKLMFQETLLVHGYIRTLMDVMDTDHGIFIPHSLIDLIEKQFYHDTKYDILSEETERFVVELCHINGDNVVKIDAFLERVDLKDKLERLLNERGLQNVWKYQMRKVVRRDIDLGKKIHYLNCISRTIDVSFRCDECEKLIQESHAMGFHNYCLFWECGHSWCNSCKIKMRDDDNECVLCKKSCNDWTQHCIKLRDFKSLLNY